MNVDKRVTKRKTTSRKGKNKAAEEEDSDIEIADSIDDESKGLPKLFKLTTGVGNKVMPKGKVMAVITYSVTTTFLQTAYPKYE